MRHLLCNSKLVQHHQTTVDSLMELGKISQDHGMWFHVDVAYANSACICPGYRHYLDGVELEDSFNMNTHK
jgi:aromatic-L-amino-acid decarboxylase